MRQIHWVDEGAHSWVVPDDVFEISIQAWGASSTTGKVDTVGNSSLTVTPGDVFDAIVGGPPTPGSTAGGSNGGMSGYAGPESAGWEDWSGWTTASAGCTTVELNGSLILVAGGGGGGPVRLEGSTRIFQDPWVPVTHMATTLPSVSDPNRAVRASRNPGVYPFLWAPGASGDVQDGGVGATYSGSGFTVYSGSGGGGFGGGSGGSIYGPVPPIDISSTLEVQQGTIGTSHTIYSYAAPVPPNGEDWPLISPGRVDIAWVDPRRGGWFVDVHIGEME